MANDRGRKGGRVTQRATPPKSSSRPPSGAAGSKAKGADAPKAKGADAPKTKGSGAAKAKDPAVETDDTAAVPSAGFVEGLRSLFAPGPVTLRERPWWGMGDMVLWFLIAQVAAGVAFYVAVAVGNYSLVYPAGPGAAVGEYTGQVAVGLTPSLTQTILDFPLALQALLQIPLWLGLVGGPLYVVWRKGTSLRVDFGFTAQWRDVPIGLAIGVVAQVLFVPLLYRGLFKLWGETYDVSANARHLTDKATSPVGFVLLLLIVGVGAPVAEELFFRGLSQRAIANRLGSIAGIVLAALLFAFAHAQSLEFPALFAFGLLLGTLAYRSGRLGPSIFAHIGFNVTAALTLVWNLPLS